MTTQQRTLSWIGAFIGFLLLVYLFEGVLLPFLVGLAIAYLLDPVCDRLEAMGCSRVIATTLVTIAFFIVVATVVAVLVPLLYGQLVDFIDQLPRIVAGIEAKLRPLIEQFIEKQEQAGKNGIEKMISDSLGDAAKLVGAIGSRLLSGLGAFVNLVSLVIVTPVVAFYLLRDWDRLVASVDGWLPRAHAETIREQFRLVDESLAGFLRGQFTVCLLLGIFYAIGLSILQLPFGAVVGLGTGLMSFIPYVGMLLGFAVGMALAIANFDSVTSMALVAGVFIIGQVIEGNFLTPKLVGDRVKLHAVWIIFALMAGGALFGFVGILLAVPVAAVIGVLVRFALRRYLESPLYLSEHPGQSAPEPASLPAIEAEAAAGTGTEKGAP